MTIRRSFRSDERDTLFVPLVSDPATTCAACDGPADDGVTLGVDRFDIFTADDTFDPTRIAKRVPGCRTCFDALQEGDEPALRDRLIETIEERTRRRCRGLSYHRVAPDRHLDYANAVREAIFADAWADEQARLSGGTLLEHRAWEPCPPEHAQARHSFDVRFAGPTCVRPVLEGGATERDEIIAATVAQWLGTNIGFAWLEATLRKCGYTLIGDRTKMPHVRHATAEAPEPPEPDIDLLSSVM